MSSSAKIALLMVGLVILGIGSCAYFLYSAGGTAQEAVTKWMKQVENDPPHLVYANASPEFKKAVTEEKLTAIFEHIRKEMGAFKKTSYPSSFNVNSTNGVKTIQVALNVTFEKGSSKATFTFINRDGTDRLVGFNFEDIKSMEPPTQS